MYRNVDHRIITMACCLLAASAAADGPRDNLPNQVRPVPPVGIALDTLDQQELGDNLAKLDRMIAELQTRTDGVSSNRLPDVEIFSRAIHQGLDYRELFSPRDVASAKRVLDEGLQRARALLRNESPWTAQTGLVVRGFRSRIDGTVQPYGLVVPSSYAEEGKTKFRLDIWLHGRGELMTEPVFIADRMRSIGPTAPPDTFVLHPYGRYSNAFKFAGEIDVLESLNHAKQNYRVDDDRIAIRGFSMGGAGCWQMAVHYPDLFFAANPGAGFAETREFLKTFQQETLQPTWFEQRLWSMYDCTGYASNLYQLPTVAYSGELDSQKQAADIMERALADEHLRLTHIIGPQTKHAIHPDSLITINEKLASLAERGRCRVPQEIRFATYTLKYNRSHWLTITQLGEHWTQARVIAKLIPAENAVDLAIQNVTELQLSIPAGYSPFAADKPVQIRIHELGPANVASTVQRVTGSQPGTDRSWDCQLHSSGETTWQIGANVVSGPRKEHNLQGPIDDAFMDAFIVVQPTADDQHDAVGKWANAEQQHFAQEWRRQFRGDAIIKRDVDVTDQDMLDYHLILFGDPTSNSVLKRILPQLPIDWTPESLQVGNETFPAAHHVPVLIYPNPLSPHRYIVINSGFTYREYAYLNNARQVPKLPDWAVVDLRTPPDSLWPGRIVSAGFFDERWQLK